MYKKLNSGHGLSAGELGKLKDAVVAFIQANPNKVLNYQAWIERSFKVASNSNDWASIWIDFKSESSYLREIFEYLAKRFSKLGTTPNDYIQFHVSNINLKSSGVQIPPHRDMLRGAGINFGIHNFLNSEIVFWEDERVKSGEIPHGNLKLPNLQYLTEVCALEYEPGESYLVDADQFHSVRYKPGFVNDLRIVGAYSLRPNDTLANYQDVEALIIKD